MIRRDAFKLLASLRTGDTVTLTRDGRTNVVTVQRTTIKPDGSQFGSWDYANVTVGYGPGRWNTEVNAAGIEAGLYAVTVGDQS